MCDLFRLHSARWQERQEPGMFATARLRSFHLEAADRLTPSGMLRLSALRVNAESIAVQYNFFAKVREYCFPSEFGPGWRKFSPDALLMDPTTRRAIEAGTTEIDFLRKREAFIDDWSARDRANRKLLLTRSAAAGEVA